MKASVLRTLGLLDVRGNAASRNVRGDGWAALNKRRGSAESNLCFSYAD